MGGRFVVESVADLPWNGRPICHGIGGRNGVEYAFYHLYAVKVSGNIALDSFKKKLESSRKPEGRLSYLEMKNVLAHEAK
jgi:hypothetical protein